MPINFDEYSDRVEEGGLTLDPETHAYRILSFLAAHPDAGFRPTELADELGIKPGSVRGTLKRLDDRGLVRHAEPYWAIGDDDRVGALIGTMSSLRAIGDRYADDQFEGWDETSVDPRELRDE